MIRRLRSFHADALAASDALEAAGGDMTALTAARAKLAAVSRHWFGFLENEVYPVLFEGRADPIVLTLCADARSSDIMAQAQRHVRRRIETEALLLYPLLAEFEIREQARAA